MEGHEWEDRASRLVNSGSGQSSCHHTHVTLREWRRCRLPDCGCECGRWTPWALRRVPLTSYLRCWPGNAAWLSPTPLAATGARSPGWWCRWLPDAPHWRSPHVSKHLRLKQVNEDGDKEREPESRGGEGAGWVVQRQKQIEINYIK